MIDNIVQNTLHPPRNKQKPTNEKIPINEYNGMPFEDTNENTNLIDDTFLFDRYNEEQRMANMSKGYDPSMSTLENAIYTISGDSYLVQGAIMLYKSIDFTTGAGALASSRDKQYEQSREHSSSLYEEANKTMISLGYDKLDLDHYWSKEEFFKQLNNVALIPECKDGLSLKLNTSSAPYDVKINLPGFAEGDSSTAIKSFMKLNLSNEDSQIPITYKILNSDNTITERTGVVSCKNLIFGDDSKGPINFNHGDYSKNVFELSNSYINRYGTCLNASLKNEAKITKALASLNIKNADALTVKDIDKILKKGSLKTIDGKKLVLTEDLRKLLEALKISKEDKNNLSQHKGNKKSFKIATDKLAQHTYKQSDVYQGSKKVAQMYKVGKTLTNMTCSSAVFLTKQGHKLALKTRLGQNSSYLGITNLISSEYNLRNNYKNAKINMKKELKTADGFSGRKKVKQKFKKDYGDYRSLSRRAISGVGKGVGNLSKKAGRASLNVARRVPVIKRGVPHVENMARRAGLAGRKVGSAANNIKASALKRRNNISNRLSRFATRFKENKFTKSVGTVIKTPFKIIGAPFNFIRKWNPLTLVKRMVSKIAGFLWSILSPIIMSVGSALIVAYIAPVIFISLIYGASSAIASVGNTISNAVSTIGEFLFGESDGYTIEEDPYGGAFGDPTSTPDGKYPYTMEDILINHPNNTLSEDLKDFYNEQMKHAKDNNLFAEKNIHYNNASGDVIDFSTYKANAWIKNAVTHIGCDNISEVTTGQFLRIKETLSFINSLYITEFDNVDNVTENDEEYADEEAINKHLFVDYKSIMNDFYSTSSSGEGDAQHSDIVNNAEKRINPLFHSRFKTINNNGETITCCSNWVTYFHTDYQINNSKCDNLVGINKYYDMSKFKKYDYSEYTFEHKIQTGMNLGTNPPTPIYKTYSTTLDKIIFKYNLNKDDVLISTRINCVKESDYFSTYKYKITENDTELMFGLEINGPTGENEKIYTADESLKNNLVDTNGNALSSNSFISSLNLVKMPTDYNKYIIKATDYPVYSKVTLSTNSYNNNDNSALISYVRKIASSNNTLPEELKVTTRGDVIIKPQTILENNGQIEFEMLVGYISDGYSTELLDIGNNGYICGGHTGCAGHYTMDVKMTQPTLSQMFTAILKMYSSRFMDTQFYQKNNDSDLLDVYTSAMEESWEDYEISEDISKTLSSSGLIYGQFINNLYELLSSIDETTPFDKIVN